MVYGCRYLFGKCSDSRTLIEQTWRATAAANMGGSTVPHRGRIADPGFMGLVFPPRLLRTTWQWGIPGRRKAYLLP